MNKGAIAAGTIGAVGIVIFTALLVTHFIGGTIYCSLLHLACRCVLDEPCDAVIHFRYPDRVGRQVHENKITAIFVGGAQVVEKLPASFIFQLPNNLISPALFKPLEHCSPCVRPNPMAGVFVAELTAAKGDKSFQISENCWVADLSDPRPGFHKACHNRELRMRMRWRRGGNLLGK
jgi:hypothetical protein